MKEGTPRRKTQQDPCLVGSFFRKEDWRNGTRGSYRNSLKGKSGAKLTEP